MTEPAPTTSLAASVKETPPDTIQPTLQNSIADKEIVPTPSETTLSPLPASAPSIAEAIERESSPLPAHRLHPSVRLFNRGVVGDELSAFATAARGKTSAAWFNLTGRSLRLRSFPLQPPKQASVSSISTASDENPSTRPSPIDRPSSASSASQDESPPQPSEPLPTASLERPSIDSRPRPTRPSVESRRASNPPPSSSRTPPAAAAAAAQNKMHQTSSRLLRMTDEERPFTRDFMDLFATLVVSLPLTAHRVRFTKIDHTFTSEEAINNLGSLKFSQSNRMPDPKDPSRIVTTTTTTTFSMAKEMARSVCQRFMDARFIEPADGKTTGLFPLKGALWQLTPKGMHLLQRFCQRNGITSRHIIDVLESPRNTMQLVILERDPATDKVSHDRATVEVIFRRFVGQDGPNIKNSTSSSDSDSLNEYANGLVGVKMARERKVVDRIVPNTFTGKAAVDWLMDCCTTVDRRETYEIAELFVQHGLMYAALEDKVFTRQNLAASRFQPTKEAIFGVTDKGQRVAGWIKDLPPPVPQEKPAVAKTTSNRIDASRTSTRDSNNNRLLHIVNDPALRLLFREYLRDTHCEENLAFYIEVREFTKQYDVSERARAFTRLDAVRENLAAAYGLYNAFLAPGSPCELNIDHNLRNSLAARMTRAVGDDESMLKSLQDVVALFKEAQQSVFKLMSSDSVPKFLKEPKYAHLLREHNFDPQAAAVQPPPGAPAPTAPSTTLPDRTMARNGRDARA